MNIEQATANILKLLRVTGSVAAAIAIAGLIFGISTPQIIGVIFGAAYVMVTIIFYDSLSRKLLRQAEGQGLLMTKLAAKTLIMVFGAYLIIAELRGAELGVVVGILCIIPAALSVIWTAK